MYAGSNRPGAVAWFGRNSKNDPHHTCRKGRNGYGLCDMTGNILEWVWDFYGVDYAQVPSRPNPTGVTTGSGRVYRGGSWADTPEGLRVANRFWQYPGDVDVSRGFRLVASALTQSPAP